MGKNNRQRRAAKLRERARSQRFSAEPTDDEPTIVGHDDRFLDAVYAHHAGHIAAMARAIHALAEAPSREVDAVIEDALERQVARAWAHGWQPTDLGRSGERELGKAEAVLLRRVIASEAASYERLGDRVAPAWMAQLRRIDAVRTWDRGRRYVRPANADAPDALLVSVRLMSFLVHLPVLPFLVDPPSKWREGTAVPAGSLPDGILDKVRALLAKAESTAFDAEADAFTAKAQELMTRHRIDRAVLDASSRDHEDAPAGRRLAITDPYADAKAVLVANIADANGCRAVWSRDMGFATVFGFAEELDAVDELFTSLLVQATAALRREGSKQDRWGRSRTTRFRRSFLVAFAVRIGQRLRDTVEATIDAASAETGRELVPILGARADATRTAAEAAFPTMGGFSPSATDGEGWHAGTRFADLADLSVHEELTRPA